MACVCLTFRKQFLNNGNVIILLVSFLRFEKTMDLNFRIVYVCRTNYLSDDEWRTHTSQKMKLLKNDIECCGLIEVNINYLKDKKSDDANYHDIEELVFQVHAKHPAGVDVRYNKRDCYNDFLGKWKELWECEKKEPSPMIKLYESNIFVDSNRRACHVANPYTDVSFGVLIYNGEFHRYASLPDMQIRPEDCYGDFLGYADFFHDTGHINIKYREWELSLSYNNIRNIIVNIDTDPLEVFFDLANPPIVYKVERKKRRDLVAYVNHRTMPLRTWTDHDTFGRSNVMRVSLRNIEEASDIISELHLRCGGKPVHYAHVVTFSKTAPIDRQLKFRHFGCEYLLTAIFKRNFTMAAQAERNLADNISGLKSLCKENARCLERALTLALAAADSGKMVNYWREIEAQYRHCLRLTDENDDYAKYVVPENCRLIRRVTVTPTRHILFAPEIMLSNRILRNFDPEYSLRVSFRDDDNTRLSFKAVHACEEVFDHAVRIPMTDGIRISGRRYSFLAWSNSQIREHCVWMYADDSRGNTVKGIRLWMGKLSHIHSVSKYMARMGQCFSQTEDTVSLRLGEGRVRTEADIERGQDVANNNRPYCFSDGVGRISSKLAVEVRIQPSFQQSNFNNPFCH